MNRILFEKREIDGDVVTFGGVRAEHVVSVLHGEVGQILKTGEIDGKIGTGEIVGIRHADGADGSPLVKVKISHVEEPPAPWVDLVMAPPRPRVMKRLLPQLASLGAGRIFLVGAKKVEKDFWGATLLNEENYRPLLVDGLMQAGTTAVPKIETRRNFRRFVTDELDAVSTDACRIVAHPYAEEGAAAPDISHPILLAIGPEGGWTDDEVSLLESHGFVRYSLGPRILRTDTAVVAILGRLMPVLG